MSSQDALPWAFVFSSHLVLDRCLLRAVTLMSAARPARAGYFEATTTGFYRRVPTRALEAGRSRRRRRVRNPPIPKLATQPPRRQRKGVALAPRGRSRRRPAPTRQLSQSRAALGSSEL